MDTDIRIATYIATTNININNIPVMNDSQDRSTAKAPLNGQPNGTRREDGNNSPIVKVQPPRREDLQPSYAQVIKPDSEDASQHGWYGGMINTLGALIGNCGAIPCCIVCPNRKSNDQSSH